MVMSHVVEVLVQIVMPCMLACVVAVMTWMVRQIIAYGNWQAAQEVRCDMHNKRDTQLEKQMPVVLSVLASHGGELENVRMSVVQLGEKVDENRQMIVSGFRDVDKRLDRLEAKLDNGVSHK